MSINAKGAGTASDLLIRGGEVSAGKDVALRAEGDINLESARSTASLSGTNQSSSGSIGISVGLGATGGVGVTLSASKGRGNEAGTDATHTNTHVTAGNTATLQSGADTTLQGAVVQANTVKAQVGGNLNLQSQQDTSDYASKSSSVGGSLTLGPAPGGSLSVGKTTINSTYASVTEQSGIKAGDGGFQVSVGQDTSLTGAVIASNQSAVQGGKNSFSTGGALTTTDIQNRAQYQGEGFSLSASYAAEHKDAAGQPVKAKPGGAAGIGSESDSANSTTSAGISGIAGNTAVRSTDPQSGIAPIFDKDRVKDSIGAQLAITAEFGKQASKAIGDYAAGQMKQAAALREQAKAEADLEKRTALNAQADQLQADWGDTGTLRLLAHTVVGGLTGGVGGAAAGTLSAPAIANSLKEAGVEGALASAITGIGSTLIGGAVGGAVGGAAALNEVANNYLKHSERVQLKKAQQDCYSNGNAAACGTAAALIYKDEVSDKLLKNAVASCVGPQCNDVSLYIQQQMSELGCAAPSACPDYGTLSAAWRIAQQKAQGLEAVYPEGWLLDAKAVLDFGRLGVRVFASAGTGAEGSLDALRQLAKTDASARRDDFQQFDIYRSSTSIKPGGSWDWQKYAPNNGAVPGTQTTEVLPVGRTLDRYGYRGGEYMSPAGTPYEARALPPGKIADPYEQYQVLKSFTVDNERIAPAFGQPGGGTQLRARIPEVPGDYATIDQLIMHGYLKVN